MIYNIDRLAEALAQESIAFNLVNNGEGTIEYKDIIWYAPDADGVNEQTDTAPITEAECDSLYNAKVDEYNSLEYSRNREKEYPSVVDQLDDIYHNGIDGWKETIQAVKDKYPKESE
tara:strand:+ start:566 stop:916 length:351 start_codon:yes stop_codon:yes gene_type:complete